MTNLTKTKTDECVACRGRRARVFAASEYSTGDEFSVYRCLACGLANTEPKLLSDELSRYYGANYYGKRKFFVDGLINVLRQEKVLRLKHFPSNAAILDIGCGNGLFLLGFLNRGWRVAGTEIAPEGYVAGKVRPFVQRGDFGTLPFSPNQFEAVTLWHSLEHMTEPVKCLRAAGKVLKKDGALVIEVPNFNSWQAKMFGPRWFHLDVPRHTYHFSENNLKQLLESENFAVTSVYFGANIFYELFGIFQSLLNTVSVRQNLVFNFINRKLGFHDIPRLLKRDIVLNAVLFFPAAVSAVPFFAVEWLFGRSGVMLMSAEKR